MENVGNRKKIGRAGSMNPPDAPHAPWPRVKLGEVCEINPKRLPHADEEQLCFLPMPLIEPGFTYKSHPEIKPWRLLKKGYTVFEKGDALVAKITPCFQNGKMCVAPSAGAGTTELHVLRAGPTIDPKYILLFCSTTSFIEPALGMLKGTVGQQRVSESYFRNAIIPLPPMAEQKKIVAKLERELAAVDAMEKKFEEMEKTAETEFKAELKEAFKEVELSGADVRRLGEVCENLDYKRIPITKSDRRSGAYPYYGASGIVDYVADYIFDGDYLLVSEDGANLEARTTPIAFSVSGKIWVNNHAHILRFAEKSSQYFVEYFIAATDISDLITGAAQPKLTQKALNAIELPYPPLPTQRLIVAHLDAARSRKDKLVAAARKGAETAALLRKALLKEAFE